MTKDQALKRKEELEAIKELDREISRDPAAEELLRAKCQWEHMTRYGVLREWSDPRTWPNYRRRKAELQGQDELAPWERRRVRRR